MNRRVLLLNFTYEPLWAISWQRAITLLFVGKVEVIESYETMLRSVSWSLPMPAVIRLTYFVRRQKHRVALTRHNIFMRDKHRCQYCGMRMRVSELTMDHVVPRSQGGCGTWENLVASCGPCNRQKGGRTPGEAQMKLLRSPSKPEVLPVNFALNIGRSCTPERWRNYLGWPTLRSAS